jgi:uncharacterized lipoprotein YmbA
MKNKSHFRIMTPLILRRLSLPGFCLLVSGLCFLPAGCSLPAAKPDAARYYVLPTLAETTVPSSSALHVGLLPVQLPDYLHSRSMAIREGASEVRYHDDERWAETLDVGLTRVLRTKLAASAQVVLYPFRSDAPRNYDVRVQVLACEGTADGGVVFSATFEIFVPGAGAGVQHAFTAEPVKWDGRDYAKLAELLGTDAAQLADAIASALPTK